MRLNATTQPPSSQRVAGSTQVEDHPKGPQPLARSGSGGGFAAVDGDDLAGDVGVGHEKEARGGVFLRGAETAERSSRSGGAIGSEFMPGSERRSGLPLPAGPGQLAR
ncbi:hypothetical protein GCM10023317_73830 [Actinopolymorpha pittospori]